MGTGSFFQGLHRLRLASYLKLTWEGRTLPHLPSSWACPYNLNEAPAPKVSRGATDAKVLPVVHPPPRRPCFDRAVVGTSSPRQQNLLVLHHLHLLLLLLLLLLLIVPLPRSLGSGRRSGGPPPALARARHGPTGRHHLPCADASHGHGNHHHPVLVLLLELLRRPSRLVLSVTAKRSKRTSLTECFAARIDRDRKVSKSGREGGKSSDGVGGRC